MSIVPPTDIEVVCLDAQTGQQIWRAKPGPLSWSSLTVVEAGLLVEELSGRKKHRYLLDLASGSNLALRQLTESGNPQAVRIETLQYSEPRTPGYELEGRKGGWLRDDPETWYHQVRNRTTGKILIDVDAPVDYQGAPNRLIATSHHDRGYSSEIFAYDLSGEKLAWHWDAWGSLPTLLDGPRDSEGETRVDGDVVYTTADQTVFALRASDGKQLWMSQPPRVQLSRDQGLATWFGRYRDLLIVQMGGQLSALRTADGKVLWSFNTGAFMRGDVPTGWQNRLYVAARPSDLPDESAYSEPLKPGWMKSVVKVSRNAGKLAVEFIHRKDVPPDHAVWSRLIPPPTDGSRRVILRATSTRKEDFDLSRAVDERSVAFVRLPPHYVGVELLMDGQPIAHAAAPTRP